MNRKFDDYIYTLSKLCFALEQLDDHQKTLAFLKTLAALRYKHRKSYQYPLVIADHFRLAKLYELLGDPRSVKETLEKIGRADIGESLFTTTNEIDGDNFHFGELRGLGWLATDIYLNRDGRSVNLAIEYKKIPRMTFKLYRQQSKSEFNKLKEKHDGNGFELVKSIPYEIRGDKFFVSLWHKKTR